MKGLVNILGISEIADMLDLSTREVYNLLNSGALNYGKRLNANNRKVRGVVDSDMLEFLLQHPEHIGDARYSGANKAFKQKLENLMVLVEIYATLKLIEAKLEYIRILTSLLHE